MNIKEKTITEIIEKNKPEIEKANAYIKSLEDEIKALKQILAYEGVGVSQEYLDECVAELRKTQEK